MYYLFVWSNLNFLHSSQNIILPTQSSLVLYSFCTNLLHIIIIIIIIIINSSSSSSSVRLYFFNDILHSK